MNIVLGVGGGIAAYKAAELARLLMQQGHAVQAVMTAGAQEFVRPLTFAALTGRKVLTDLFPQSRRRFRAPSSISVAQENDLLVVAPATADLLAKFAHGLADDFLTTLYLAFTGPVVLAPAMNTNMWQHAATQSNLETLRRRGHRIVDPDRRRAGLRHGGSGPPGRARSRSPRRCEAEIAQAARPGWRDRADHRRSHAGAARPGALHFQSLQRQDGLRAGRGRRRARRAR